MPDAAFVSFAARWPNHDKALVGIRSARIPADAANVARNVIARELGHAIGLGPNSDAAALKRGRGRLPTGRLRLRHGADVSIAQRGEGAPSRHVSWRLKDRRTAVSRCLFRGNGIRYKPSQWLPSPTASLSSPALRAASAAPLR
jgi:hypothetical protein